MNMLAPPRGGSVIDQLVAELSARAGVRTKAIGDPYLHGPNGLWSVPGLERPVISTRVIPRGIAGLIPSRPSNVENPLYPYLTGFTDPAEVQPIGPCDDPPVAGQMKNCTQTATFGRYSYRSRQVDLSRLGQIVNRAEFTDLLLVNDPLGNEGGNDITSPANTPAQLALNNELGARNAELAIKFQNKLTRQLYEGNPANNTNGGYAEFPGLDHLIGTGKRDAITGVACPSLDSLMVNMNYKNVNGTTGNDTIINVLTYSYRMLRNLATRTRLDPAEWVFAMRETLFYELTAQWPCTYLTYRCITTQGNEAVVNASDAVAMRDAMRQGNYLVIDGQRVNVVLDDGINEETSGDTNKVTAGNFASDIFILPLRVAGNFAALFWEYFAWNGPGAALSAEVQASLPLIRNWFWTDAGQYLWHMKPPVNWCVEWLAMVKPRLVLRTPHLAARIQNIQYSPLMHPRDAYPDDPYFVNGGNTSRNTAPSFYRSWS